MWSSRCNWHNKNKSSKVKNKWRELLGAHTPQRKAIILIFVVTLILYKTYIYMMIVNKYQRQSLVSVSLSSCVCVYICIRKS